MKYSVSDLDVESKLTFHYQAPWTPQRNFFLPSTRPACLEELHHRAHDQTPSLQIDHQQRRTLSRERRVTICVSVAPPTGDYPSPHSPLRGKHRARSVSTGGARLWSDSERVNLSEVPGGPGAVPTCKRPLARDVPGVWGSVAGHSQTGSPTLSPDS
ncbi:unnamed protein product [Arctogadus glacialis]